ncbi:MAG TPA: phage portal protein [Anaerolineae bacterium]|nr:phage portal protein [Anaerolineae bacterium]
MQSFLKAVFQNRAPLYVSRGVRAIGGYLGSGSEVLLKTYGSVGTVFAIVDRIITATAGAHWHLYQKAKPGQELKEVFSHPALDLWEHPNPFYDQQEFVETIQQHLDLVGETIWYVGRSNANLGPPLELWPIRPDRVQPVPDPVEFIKGWVYTCPGEPPMPWKTNEVIQLKRPNPLDPYRGLGPVQSILVDIDSERYSATWNRNFFLNSAEPGGIIQFDQHLSDEEFDEFRERWQEQHKGVANAHRVALLEKGTWVDRKYTQRDMQFEQMRHLNREIIREAFGFPKPMLGAVDDVNRANAEAAEVVFARWLITPRLERIKRALNTKLLPMYGTSGAGLEFGYDSPVPEDVAAAGTLLVQTVTAAKMLIDSGFDQADVLVQLDLPEIKVSASPKPEPEPNPVASPNPFAKAGPRKANEKRMQSLFSGILNTELRKTLEELDEDDLK